MTRSDLIVYAFNLYYHCTADKIKVTDKSNIYSYEDLECAILESCNTIAGIYSYRTGTFYAFMTHSNSIVKSIYKAAKILNAMGITWLCVRSDKCIERYIGHYADESRIFYADKEELDNLIRCDWSSEIETKWKRV